MSGKVMSMREAISRFVKEGDTLFIGGSQHGEPVAAIHEIIRQGIGHLTEVSALCSPVGLLLREGLLDRVITGYMGQDEKASYGLRRAREIGKFPVIEESSHFAISLMLRAGQMNIPFIPARILLGSDMMVYNPENLSTVDCPFTDQTLAAIKAVRPDVGILHCQQADADGNAQKWGSLGVDYEGLGASKTIIITTEKIVDSDVIQRNPNATIIPGFRVAAVVEVPWGAHPVHLAGCYTTDRSFGMNVHATKESSDAFMQDFVFGVADREGYLAKLKEVRGENHLETLRIKNPLYSEPIVTGY